ncbi:MAG: diacylglycerol kinase family protein [Bacteroidota bacterium]|nr:diacylglycerol kinase family protein [Bacteroidota bacterium]
MSWKAVFIINPKAGSKRNIDLSQLITKTVENAFSYKIIIWESPQQDLESIVDDEIKNGYNLFVAVGGDGTVNRVGSILVNKDAVFGIIPMGSGNGLARFLKIPLNTVKAIKYLKTAKTKIIDSCSINGKTFLCTAGVGFDAHIGKLFANNTKRGLYSYISIIFNQFFSYKPEEYILEFDDKKICVKAYLITFANANQWGNNAIIAPEANILDGIINVTVLRPFNKLFSIPLMIRLFNKTIHHSCYIDTYKTKEITIKRKLSGAVHYDGEPDEMNTEIKIKIHPSSLKIALK